MNRPLPMPTADPQQHDRLAFAARNGDERAFDELFAATYRPLRVFVALHARSAELVDEVVQASFVAAFESLASYRGGGAFMPWLKSIARSKLAAEYRWRRRSTTIDGVEVVADEEPSVPESEPLHQRLGDCLQRLGPAAQALLRQRYRDGIAVQDIASSQGRSASAISVSLFKIRTALKDCLGGALHA